MTEPASTHSYDQPAETKAPAEYARCTLIVSAVARELLLVACIICLIVIIAYLNGTTGR